MQCPFVDAEPLKVYLLGAFVSPYLCDSQDFEAGSPIHLIEMKLASVKDIGKNRLQMHTPYAPYV